LDRLFLDANVLFSAAYRKDSGLLRFWDLPETELVMSVYALEEARRNLETEDQSTRLNRLMKEVEVLPELRKQDLPPEVKLAEKDKPILAAALAAGASHLITGDRQHFGRYFGQRVRHTRITTTRDYLVSRERQTSSA
jgi:predicted nucleic acid-binding protein